MGMHLPDKETGKGKYQWKTSQFALEHFWKPQKGEILGTKKGLGDSSNWTQAHYTWSNKNPGLHWNTHAEKQLKDKYS